MGSKPRFFLRIDTDTRRRLGAVAAHLHEPSESAALRRLVHEAFEKHDCRGQGCAICQARVAELAGTS